MGLKELASRHRHNVKVQRKILKQSGEQATNIRRAMKAAAKKAGGGVKGFKAAEKIRKKLKDKAN